MFNIYKISLTRSEIEKNCYDYKDSYVIIAKDERRVRELASNSCGEEGRNAWFTAANIELLGKTKKQCSQEERIVISSYNAG